MEERSALSLSPAEAAPQQELRELTDIRVDRSLHPSLRLQRFIADVRDPYHFTVNGTDVKVSFTGSGSFNTRLTGAISAVVEAAGDRHFPRVYDAISERTESTVA